jgi:FADH2 O2-dependent halogenase
MTSPPELDADVIIVGGGPSGSALGTFLARDGHRVLLVEKDIHPRDHVGESLTPSTNLVLDELGFIDRMDQVGFVHKPGTGWNGPRSLPWRFVEIWLFEYPIPNNPRPYAYNVERDVMDAMLLRWAHDHGVRILQGVGARQVLFEGGRAVGVRVSAGDGWERDLRARLVVDASGRRCLLARQLRMIHKDPKFNQFAIYSWFSGVKELPKRLEGFTVFYFLGLEKGWSWHIPLRNGICSVGTVVDKSDFQKSGRSEGEFFRRLISRSRNFSDAMKDAEQIRPFYIHGDYSYKIDRFAGPGWLLIGDALRFVDPIFSSGVDVALFSAKYAYEAIKESWQTGNEEASFRRYQQRVETGVDVWYDMIEAFYSLQNLFTVFAVRRRWRELLVKTLQGNPYLPESQERARHLLNAMIEARQRIMAAPDSLLRPWALTTAPAGSEVR